MPNVSSFGAQTDNAVVSGTVTDRKMIIPEVPPQGLMSVGPRVTPNFVKPREWNAQTTYHFFDAVRDTAGNAYVATKPVVPEGTPLTDENYWFLWADPDARYDALNETVKTFDQRITTNQTNIAENSNAIADNAVEIGKIKNQLTAQMGDFAVVFGNSYTMGANVPDNGMFKIISKYFDKSKMFWTDGVGFMPYTTGTIVNQNSFNDLVLRAESEMPQSDRALVTDVFFVMAMGDARYASCNDVLQGTSIYVQRVLATIKKTKTVFPNAIVHVLNAELKALKHDIGYTTAYDVWNVNRSFDEWYKTYGIHWVGMLAFSIWGDANMVQADGYHPTAEGYKRLDTAFVNAMHGQINNGIGKYVLNGIDIKILSSEASGFDETNTTKASSGVAPLSFKNRASSTFCSINARIFNTKNITKILVRDSMHVNGAIASAFMTIYDGQEIIYSGFIGHVEGENETQLCKIFEAPITFKTGDIKIYLSNFNL